MSEVDKVDKVDTRLLQSGMTRLRFRLTPAAVEVVNHALDLAQSLTSCRSRAAALDIVALSYIAGPPTAHSLDGPASGSERFLIRLYRDQYEMVRGALDAARGFASDDASALVMICSSFLIEEGPDDVNQAWNKTCNSTGQLGATENPHLPPTTDPHVWMTANDVNQGENVMTKKIGKKVEVQSKNKEQDVFIATVKEVHKLAEEDVIPRAEKLNNTVGGNYFRLGCLLDRIDKEQLWKKEGYAKFEEFVWDRLCFRLRKAQYLIKIYTDLVDAEVPWAKVQHLGWTKLRELSSVLTSDNVDECVSKAGELTVAKLREVVKSSPEHLDDPLASTGDSTNLTFKIYPEQRQIIELALDGAKQWADAEDLERICLDYLAGHNPTLVSVLQHVMKNHTPEEIWQTFEKEYPDIDVTVAMH